MSDTPGAPYEVRATAMGEIIELEWRCRECSAKASGTTSTKPELSVGAAQHIAKTGHAVVLTMSTVTQTLLER